MVQQRYFDQLFSQRLLHTFVLSLKFLFLLLVSVELELCFTPFSWFSCTLLWWVSVALKIYFDTKGPESATVTWFIHLALLYKKEYSKWPERNSARDRESLNRTNSFVKKIRVQFPVASNRSIRSRADYDSARANYFGSGGEALKSKTHKLLKM